MNFDIEGAFWTIFIISVLAIVAIQPKFEADAYTKLTGKKVTYWDAVWCDLRVQESIKQQ